MKPINRYLYFLKNVDESFLDCIATMYGWMGCMETAWLYKSLFVIMAINILKVYNDKEIGKREQSYIFQLLLQLFYYVSTVLL